jgi:hypothetical protein
MFWMAWGLSSKEKIRARGLMTQIQSLLIIGGMTLLSTLILSRGSNTINNISRTLHIEAVSAAFSIGQSAIEQINSVAFDEKTISGDIKLASELSTIGKDTGETQLNHFDDVDDFNDYTWSESTEKLGAFNANIKVSYGSNADPDITTNSKTFYKKIEILITSLYLLQDTLRIQTIRGY